MRRLTNMITRRVSGCMRSASQRVLSRSCSSVTPVIPLEPSSSLAEKFSTEQNTTGMPRK
jgi:hypothetical protein